MSLKIWAVMPTGENKVTKWFARYDEAIEWVINNYADEWQIIELE